MTIFRNEIRTGLLVVTTLTALVALLIYLGAPGVFVAQKTLRIYFDNAAGLEPGAPVLLAGRKIGQIRTLYSPVPEKDRPEPKLETLVEVEVDKSAKIFTKVKAQLTQPSLLGKPVIDFTTGEEASGLAPEGTFFIGERQPGLADAVPTVLEKLDPVLAKATATLENLQKTAHNLSQITSEGSDLPLALAEYRKFGTHLRELSGPNSSLRRSLKNIETLTSDGGKLAQALDNIAVMTGPESDLEKTLANAEKFTSDLSNNKDIAITLKNFRRTSENLETHVARLGSQLSVTAANLQQASDTVKRQPWRLIWPGTKEYENDGRIPPQPPPKSKSGKR